MPGSCVQARLDVRDAHLEDEVGGARGDASTAARLATGVAEDRRTGRSLLAHVQRPRPRRDRRRVVRVVRNHARRRRSVQGGLRGQTQHMQHGYVFRSISCLYGSHHRTDHAAGRRYIRLADDLLVLPAGA